jgi:hypothetical protein
MQDIAQKMVKNKKKVMLNTQTHVAHKYVPNYQFATTCNNTVSFISQKFHRRKSATKEKIIQHL